jgi:plasmid stability protein
MSQILVRDLSPETIERLKQRAKDNRRSLNAEVLTILEEAVPRRRTLDERREAMERLRSFADWALERSRGIPQSNSTDAIREDRDTR